MEYGLTAIHDPNAVLDYGINWGNPTATGGPWLVDGDTITASEWAVYEPDGYTTTTELVIDSDSHDTTHTIVWISGGERGNYYVLTNHITTAQGREEDRSILIRCKEK